MAGRAILSFGLFFLTGIVFAQAEDDGKPHVPDYLVESRIEKLNRQTPMPFTYNRHVQAYVDVYTQKRPDHLSKILGRAEMYFPLFEEYLDKYELPLELKYLAVIESALDPGARSSSGAVGLWQFLYQASRMFDLEVTSYIDERCDPVKATDAACRYLKYLYRNFDDWLLVIAAYNGGIGTVKNAIEKAGGETDFWKLRPHLTDQIRGYVPAFIAVNYAMSYHHSYGIEAFPGGFTYDDLLTTSVTGGVSFEQISEKTGISMDVLRKLNPAYKMDYVPVQPGPVRMVIPENKIDVFHQKQPLFRTEIAPPAPEKPVPGDTTGRVKTEHIVAPGEFFHEIAMQYQCRVEDLMHWNNLDKKFLHAGQVLTVWKPEIQEEVRVRVPEIEKEMGQLRLNAGILISSPDG